MPNENSLISKLSLQYNNSVTFNIVTLALGVFLISILAQISISLPWTPVPITGQTFGVTLMSLNWGWRRSTIVMFIYILLGSVGFPIFALGKSGLMLGPTSGYLIGMFVSSLVVGSLSDRGWTKNFLSSYLAATLGSLIVFLFGTLVLSFYIPADQLFNAGILPFLPGDVIKSTLACSLTRSMQQIIRNQNV